MPSGLTATTAYGAQLEAVATGNPVEDLSQRTESRRVFALPGGVWRAEESTGIERVRVSGDGMHEADWAALDPILALGDDGRVHPVVFPRVFALAPGGGPTDVVLAQQVAGTDVVVRVMWDGSVLPVGVLDGGRITYPDAWPGVDLVFDVTPLGFEQYFVVKTREAAVANAGRLSLDLAVENGSVVDDGAGGVQVLDAVGTVVSGTSTAFAWDADEDAKQPRRVLAPWSDEPNLSPGIRVHIPGVPEAVADAIEAETAGRELPTNVPVALGVESSPGGVRVAVGLEGAWWDDPATVFPVVIDPSLGPKGTTYVRSNTPTTEYHTSSELLIGTWDEGASKYRAFINFDTTSLKGVEILDADLKIYNHWSGNCTSSWSWKVHDSYYQYNPTTTWNSQPGVNYLAGTSTQTKGNQCAEGWVYNTVTDMVQNWADDETILHALRISAGSETNDAYWKRFRSVNSAYPPKLEYTYNHDPDTPTSLTVETTDLTQSGDTDISAASPALKATITDDEGGQVFALFDVYETGPYGGGEYLVASHLEGGSVSSGSESEYDLPTDLLTPGATYRIVVWASDGSQQSTSSLEATGTFTWTYEVSTSIADDVPTDCDADVGAVDPAPTPTPSWSPSYAPTSETCTGGS